MHTQNIPRALISATYILYYNDRDLCMYWNYDEYLDIMKHKAFLI